MLIQKLSYAEAEKIVWSANRNYQQELMWGYAKSHLEFLRKIKAGVSSGELVRNDLSAKTVGKNQLILFWKPENVSDFVMTTSLWRDWSGRKMQLD